MKTHHSRGGIAEQIGCCKSTVSPEQIVGDAGRRGIECVCHERIYQFVWQDRKQGGSMYRHMRTKGKRHAKRGSAKGKRGHIVGRIDIDQRPAIVEEKRRVGDLEMNLVIGRGHSGVLLTINDRATGMLKMAILESREATLVQAKAVELLMEWRPLLHTGTTDNGKEFAHHQKLTDELEVGCYFARPYHSWQRGGRPVPRKRKFEWAGAAVLPKVGELRARHPEGGR